MPEYEGKVNAPDFPEGMEWINTDKPISLRDLRGKVVILDFWTYCCINCIHIIPDLKKLEAKYANELVVIGVHSAKFTGERESANIRQAVLRYGIEHPVVNDNQMQIWSQYAVRAWPTLILIDPTGKVVGYHSGEGIYDIFDRAVQGIINTFDPRGLIDRKPLALKLEKERKLPSVLNFPGKVLADETSGLLFIADSNHHRIVVLRLKDGSFYDVIGGGARGKKDGNFDQAAFANPQGMAFDAQTRKLYIADTDNHAIRAADLEKRSVETLAGTGEQTKAYPGRAGAGKTTALNSPWDVVLHQETLYIAMAGSHQLWRLNLKTLQVQPHAGTGREAVIDGSNDTCALAQPSGITTDGEKLYFADSEVSCIRMSDIDPRGKTETLVGGDLFEFGDIDGVGREARLQHPLCVVYHDGMLYVADTYNNKIKRLDPKTKRIETFVGTGAEGMADGLKATFDEPGGISYALGKLYVADTNNHLIRVIDLKTKQTSALQIKGMEKLIPKVVKESAPVIDLPVQTLAPGEGALRLHVLLPLGYKLNDIAPTRARVQLQNAATAEGKTEWEIVNPAFPLTLPIRLNSQGSAQIEVDLTLYYCESGKEALCFVKEARLKQPLTISANATQTEASIEFAVKIETQEKKP